MNLILFTKYHDRPVSIQLSQPRCLAAISGIVLLLGSAILLTGYWLAGEQQNVKQIDASVIQAWKLRLVEQKQALQDTREVTQANINALAQQVGQLQAHVLRMEALGQRLTEMAKLDKGEFNFDELPAQGGPASAADLQSQNSGDLLRTLDELSVLIDDREQQLAVLETFLMHSNLQKQVKPAGRPIRKGWMSSRFGKRSDPFTGKKEFHAGMDFAGKLGSDVIAVAAGVVTWSGDRWGYGNLVEIDHGNGYVTRYGHNSKILVNLGDSVKPDQVIAKMGSSGRSTGPHVHYEVLLNNRAVNPLKYTRASR